MIPCFIAVIESFHVESSQVAGGLHFPKVGLSMQNISGGQGMDDLLGSTATITFPPHLFNNSQKETLKVANLLIMNTEQFFPTVK